MISSAVPPYSRDRLPSALRPISLERGVNRYAEGSALVRWGDTVVHCTATVEEKVPTFLRGTGGGWVSAEYAMLPRATHDRTPRDVQRGRLNGRSSEIQRLIGRSLRAAVDLGAIGERTVWIDCDVLQADGGTRTASITASFVCLVDALRCVARADAALLPALREQVAAVSVGKVDGRVVLDLCYEEDRAAEVDCNVVKSARGDFIEIQGTGEDGVFSRAELDEMLSLADAGLEELFGLQREALDLTPAEKEFFDGLRG